MIYHWYTVHDSHVMYFSVWGCPLKWSFLCFVFNKIHNHCCLIKHLIHFLPHKHLQNLFFFFNVWSLALFCPSCFSSSSLHCLFTVYSCHKCQHALFQILEMSAMLGFSVYLHTCASSTYSKMSLILNFLIKHWLPLTLLFIWANLNSF